MLEPYEGKLSRTVLRGLETGNGLRLLGNQEVCGSCATCSLICPTDAIRLEKREVS